MERSKWGEMIFKLRFKSYQLIALPLRRRCPQGICVCSTDEDGILENVVGGREI